MAQFGPEHSPKLTHRAASRLKYDQNRVPQTRQRVLLRDGVSLGFSLAYLPSQSLAPIAVSDVSASNPNPPNRCLWCIHNASEFLGDVELFPSMWDGQQNLSTTAAAALQNMTSTQAPPSHDAWATAAS